jgi:hypothetical protein
MLGNRAVVREASVVLAMLVAWGLLAAGVGTVAGTAPGTLGGALVLTLAGVGLLATGIYAVARLTTEVRGDAEDWTPVVVDARDIEE